MTRESDTPRLDVKGLQAGYGPRPVLHGVNLRVDRGEIVALLGGNGAGKSTTLLAIAGELPGTTGDVRLDGRPLTGPLYKRARRGVALVPEEHSIFRSLTVDENLRLGRGPTEQALLFAPLLEGLRRRRAGLCSGGEQRVLALARGLAAGPAVLLADELSLGLAPRVVGHMFELCEQAAAAGTGVLLVEQQARRALAIADRFYVLNRGSVVLEGDRRDVGSALAEIERVYLHAPA